MVVLVRCLREPLVVFLLVGGALFGLYRCVAPVREDERRVVVSAEVIRGLRAEHERRSGAPPTAAEVVERYVEAEVLYREALLRGLDRGDVIVRRRLVQKMEFLTEAEADGDGDERAPDEAALAVWLAAHRADYARPERVTIEQVY